MITTILRPFTALWRSMVNYHRRHLTDDPDVARLREQEQQAQRVNQRLNAVERRYLGRRP